MDILKECERIKDEIISHRRYLHKHAEVGLSLPKTERYIVETLFSYGYTPKVFDGGVIADVGKGKTFLLRADCDALPIKEKTGLPFASKRETMHACGHDMHASALLGCAKILKANETRLHGNVRLLFQFGEERLQGAKKAIQAGVLEGAKGAFSLHVSTASSMPLGTCILGGAGNIAPCADFFAIEITGKSAHGATPEAGADALLAGAKLVSDLCMLPAREITPANPAVLTVGKFTAGVAPNAIADQAVLEGTLRSWDLDTQKRLLSRVKALSLSTAKACRVKSKFTVTGGCPALKNDPVLREETKETITRIFGTNALVDASGQKGGGSEDFAYISQKVPAVFVAVVAGEREKGFVYPLHHPKTDFDEDALSYLSALFCAVALQNR